MQLVLVRVAIGSEKAKQEKAPVTGRSLKQTEKPSIKVKATLDSNKKNRSIFFMYDVSGKAVDALKKDRRQFLGTRLE